MPEPALTKSLCSRVRYQPADRRCALVHPTSYVDSLESPRCFCFAYLAISHPAQGCKMDYRLINGSRIGFGRASEHVAIGRPLLAAVGDPELPGDFRADQRAAGKFGSARVGGEGMDDVRRELGIFGGGGEALAKLPVEARQVAEVLLGKDSPTDIEREDIRQYLNRADRNKYGELTKKVDSFQATSPLAPPRAMVVADNKQPTQPRVLIRGNPARPGNTVPRQFLLVLAGQGRQPFADGSGRLELAKAIVAPENPLIFSAGPFAGTSFSNANRTSVGCKSPLTGGVKEANGGGTFGYAMGQLKIAGFTLHGAAPDWVARLLAGNGTRQIAYCPSSSSSSRVAAASPASSRVACPSRPAISSSRNGTMARLPPARLCPK